MKQKTKNWIAFIIWFVNFIALIIDSIMLGQTGQDIYFILGVTNTFVGMEGLGYLLYQLEW